MKLIVRLVLGFAAFCAAFAASAIVVRRLVPEDADPRAGSFSLVAAMDGRDFLSVSDDLSTGSVLAYMGGVELDLTEASIGEVATLEVTAVMGGVDVVVPAGWRVEASANAYLGGFENLTDPDEVAEDAPVLLVGASLVMGGMAIRNPERVDGS